MAAEPDDIAGAAWQRFAAANRSSRTRSLLPDPQPRPVEYPLISADDHFLEPPDLFEGRIPAKFADAAPRLLDDPEGMQFWLLDDHPVYISGGNAHSGWAVRDRTIESVRYEEVRPGTYDVHERILDMNRNGVLASLCFPSMIFGFCGQSFSKFSDPELGLAIMRAYNQWILEEWVGAYPDRFLPCQVPWLQDAEVAAEEIRKNARLGFTSVAFTENPQRLGLPSLYSGYWGPFFEACSETNTVINLHVGSSSEVAVPSKESPLQVQAVLFAINAFASATDWLFAGIPVRYPDIKIVMSESGIGFLPLLYDRLDFTTPHYPRDNEGGLSTVWTADLSPIEVLQRNFWFTCYWDPRTFKNIGSLNADRIMFEVDYPHTDSTWPDSQETIRDQLSSLEPDVVHKLLRGTASAVYRHQVPPVSVLALKPST